MDKGEELDVPTLFEIMKDKSDLTYNEAAKLQEELRLKKEAGSCITAGMKRDKDAMELQKMKKKAQEAEGELSIIKGIGMSSPEMNEAQQKIKALDSTISGLINISTSKQQEITELNIRVAELLEIDESHQKQMGKLQVRLTEVEEVLKSKDYTKAPDYNFLVNENKKLHKEIDELKRGKKKLVNHIEDRVHRTRKAGF